MHANPFIADIRSQAAALRDILASDVVRAVGDIAIAQYDRIVLSGMGASLFALYPAWLSAVDAGAAAWWLDASELLTYAPALVTPRTLVILASQSGRSAEVVALLNSFEGRRPACLVGVTNDAESPLGQGADRMVPLLSGAEHTVSTRSYLNTLTAASVVTSAILGLNASVASFYRTVEVLDRYLGPEWDRHVAAIGNALGQPERLVILGRGPALATAWQGALVIKEAAKVAAEGLGAAQFRHGPIELADTRLTAVILEGSAATADLNRRLACDLQGWGAHVLWIGRQTPPGIMRLPTPEADGAAREVVDIVPLEIASVTLAEAHGVVPGVFRHGGKVTTVL